MAGPLPANAISPHIADPKEMNDARNKIKAALDKSAAIQTEAQFISRWMSMLDDARLSVLAAHQLKSHEERQSVLEKEGIKLSIKNLRTFPFVRDLEDKGKLNLHGAHFDIKTGDLSILNHSRGIFYPL